MRDLLTRKTHTVVVPLADGGERQFTMTEMSAAEEDAFTRELQELSAEDFAREEVLEKPLDDVVKGWKSRGRALIGRLLPEADEEFLYNNLTVNMMYDIIERQIFLNGTAEIIKKALLPLEAGPGTETESENN